MHVSTKVVHCEGYNECFAATIMALMDQKINSTVHVVVQSESMNIPLSISSRKKSQFPDPSLFCVIISASCPTFIAAITTHNHPQLTPVWPHSSVGRAMVIKSGEYGFDSG